MTTQKMTSYCFTLAGVPIRLEEKKLVRVIKINDAMGTDK